MKQIFLIVFLFISFESFCQADSTISVVSLKNTKVVYRGITNRIKIAVPGSSSFAVTGTGELEKTDSLGNYRWNVTKVSGLVALIYIDATIADGSRIHEEKLFDIKNIEDRIAYTDSYHHEIALMTIEELKNLKIKTTIPNLHYDFDKAYEKVESFTINVKGIEPIMVKGDSIPPKVFALLKNLPQKTEIKINYISTYNPHGYDLMPLNSLRIIISDQERFPKLKPIINNSYGSDILYRGTENLLTFEIPESNSFKVSAPDLEFHSVEDSIYRIDVSEIKRNFVSFTFEVMQKDGTILVLEDSLHVRDITPKKVTINDKSCKDRILKLKRSELKDAKLDVKIDSPEEPWANFQIFGFTVKIPGGKTLEGSGDSISDEIFQKLAQLPNNSVIEIAIPKYGFQGFTYDPAPLRIMITDK